MIQDPLNRFIATINSHFKLAGKRVLEVGCGKGRVTRDLAAHARQVVATDTDADAIATARQAVPADNVTFIVTADGLPATPPASFDAVLYTLSLHHVPETEMVESLQKAGQLLRPGGVIIVVEPGDGGSFNEAKQRFGAGSGDEGPLKEAAIRAMQALPGWEPGDTIPFQTHFLFDDEQDFCRSKLPGYQGLSEAEQKAVMNFLGEHRTDTGILLSSDRRLNILTRS